MVKNLFFTGFWQFFKVAKISKSPNPNLVTNLQKVAKFAKKITQSGNTFNHHVCLIDWPL